MLRKFLAQRLSFNYWVILLSISCYFVIADDTAKTKQLTLCTQQSGHLRSLIFVSTLDGKISALDAANNGQKQWSLDFGNKPMLSSNIHNRELNDNGQWIRLIPSLNGGLYKFDGDNLETLPITTDQLLHSSYRYSNDLIFSGGKEVHSYGVHTRTGKILYECDITGCKNNTGGEGYLEQEVLVIKRLQQTIRAVEARTGIERWNFSVGQHDLVLVPPTETYCPDKVTLLDVEIKSIIPEGLVWAVNESDPIHKLWQYKFDSPIVSIWRENANQDTTDQDFLERINLFDGTKWVWGTKYSTNNPSLYVGMHQRQLYVQENLELKNSLRDSSSVKHAQPMVYPWLPYPAIGNGFYLYAISEIKPVVEGYNNSKSTLDMEKPMLTYIEEENNKSIEIIWSLFYRWEIILAISIIVFLHFTWPLKYFNRNIENGLIPPVVVQTIGLAVEAKSDDTILDENGSANDFKSRYLTDFEQVDCLGKGGYGVVFEVKNRVDHRNYAIKRITLPDNKDSRVMREVRALAKLEHRNIVRYFNSWLECPPSGWQEEHDKQWSKLASSGCPSLITETEAKLKDSVCIDVSQTDSPSVERPYEPYKLDNTQMTNELVVIGCSSEKQHDDNALYIIESPHKAYKLNNTEITNNSIVFEYSNEKQRDDNAIYIGDSTNNSDVLSNNITKDPLSANVDNSNYSESIVFEGSDNNVLEETTHASNNVTGETTSSNVTEEIDQNNTEEKERCKRRKATLALDLNTKSNARKSVKVFLYIQMELCQRLSLKEWLKQDSIRDPSRVLSIFQQIIDAVEYIHLQGLIHRDLKPSNIFFAFDNSIKVGDFGLVTGIVESYDGTSTPEFEDETATLMDCVHTACVGTHLYMSPEQANGQTYNYKVDIYSLGIIYFELLTPFSTDMERAIVLTDLRKSIFPKNFAEKHTTEYKLLQIMLHDDPSERPTTVGIKARLPLLNNQAANEHNIDKDLKSHFELPRRIRHSSISSSNNISFES
ncbi:eukaryotic translation initiation factor 2-alpha kinase isoform X2 [Odontomachus brunneus]|uniref:eukaryotic translation initiation factor 2-alpha kinase isoform X2 n=1 Tax=Odontomachus brunneus TaxID=486640 RepID=UPI0013F25EFB|nr:eukaryotic translation initiation factor 2-alpha kinase isoform X2 [Odontomachus brunneus]